MTSRETEQDRHGENFCQIEFSNNYLPIWSGELVQLAKEVWSIMDQAQRAVFLDACGLDWAEYQDPRDPIDPLLDEAWSPERTDAQAVPGQQIPPGGAPVEWQE